MPCKTREPAWYRDPDQLREEYAAHGTFEAVALEHGGCATTLVKWWHRNKLPPLQHGSKTAAKADSDEVTLDVDKLGEIAEMLRARGLDPEQWIVIRAIVNAWEGFYKTEHPGENDPGHETVPLKQMKVTLRPRLETLFVPARDVRPLPKPRAPSKGKPRLMVFVGDEQAPYHDPDLHRLFLQWLAHNQPHEAVHLGDLMDLPTLSRHRPNPEWNASPQACIQAGYEILRAYRESSPDTRWSALPGNHDERLRDYQLQRAPAMFGIRPADLDERELAAVHSLPTLLHLEALGIAWHGSDADYEHAQVDISDDLVARHGFITGQNSAERTVRKLGLSVVVGHTHRQVVTYVTEERRRESLTMLGVEAGCMCLVRGGLGYVVNPAWQQGAYAATVWPDGTFNGEHIRYRDGVLTWRDQRYERKKAA